MKKLLMMLILAMMTVPAMAQEHSHDHNEIHLKQVEAQYICMVNDTAFDKPQIPVKVEGKTYYGCCQMCEARLKNDPTIRTATDPVSNAEVDKTEAVIGADVEGRVYYFESEENLHSFQIELGKTIAP